MRLLHTKLPEFIKKMQVAAATKGERPKDIKIEGLENLKSAKMQSLRTGRIELAVEELVADERTDRVELLIRPRVPETEHTAIIKSYDKDGKAIRAILDTITILHGTEELDLYDCNDIVDRRARLGQQS